MVDEVRIVPVGPGLEIRRVDLDDMREQDKNARSMGIAMFVRLQETIARDQRLESLPFCASTPRGLEIVSGHHRVRAARAAGLKECWTLVDTTGLTHSQIVAKQLAHNALAGQDDAAMLEELLKEITAVADMQEAFVHPKDAALKKVVIGEVSIDLEPRSVMLTFVPLYYDKWERLIKEIPPAVDDVALVDGQLVERFGKAMKAVGRSYNIKAATPIVCRMIDLAEGLMVGAEDDYAYTADVCGARLPKELASRLDIMWERMKNGGEVKSHEKWKVIEKLLGPATGSDTSPEPAGDNRLGTGRKTRSNPVQP